MENSENKVAATVPSLALLGWMGEDEALRLLLDNCAFPAPLTETAARALWREYRDRTGEIALARCYQPAAARPVGGEIAARLISAARGFTEMVVEVDPAMLLAFQFVIALERADFHAASGASWAERCLPTQRPRHAMVVSRERNKIAFDIPHAEHALVATPEGELRVEQFPAFVMVADYHSQLVLAAGYHRAYAYLTARPRPSDPFLAAVTEAETVVPYDEDRRAKLSATSPPLVADFLNCALALTLPIRRVQYRFEITADLRSIPL